MKKILINDDCNEAMDKLISDKVKVNLALTDPPYNISKSNSFCSMGRRGIDFGNWDKGFDLFSYIDRVYELLDKDGSFIVFNDWKNLGDISRYAEKVGFVTKDIIRFEKSNPMPRNMNRRYITDTEYAIWLTMPKAKWTFNRITDGYQRPKFVYAIEKGLHPTQKPVGLMEDLIMIHSNVGDTVLDPFMGSGTTGVACQWLNRNFIGMEMDKDYFKIAENRVNIKK